MQTLQRVENSALRPTTNAENAENAEPKKENVVTLPLLESGGGEAIKKEGKGVASQRKQDAAAIQKSAEKDARNAVRRKVSHHEKDAGHQRRATKKARVERTKKIRKKRKR